MEPKWQKMTSKRVLKYGVCPKGAPSGSDGAWRVPLEAIWGSFLMILGCIFIAFSCSFPACILYAFSLFFSLSLNFSLCFISVLNHADNDGDAQRLKKRYVILNCFHTVFSRDRSAIQPRRKERSSAQCAAAGRSPAFNGVPDHS